jgi:transposase-like protein
MRIVPRQRTAIIERYRWRESSVEETLMEMYLAGVSVRRVGTARRVVVALYAGITIVQWRRVRGK